MTDLEREALLHCVATLANVLWRQLNPKIDPLGARVDYDRMLDLLKQLTAKRPP
jgi:hypothetical protein